MIGVSRAATLALALPLACAPGKGGADSSAPAAADPVLQMGPLPELPPDPTNAWADDAAAAALGQRLFYDPLLSGDGRTACASCHRPDAGFADPTARSVAAGEAARHTPSLWNAGFARWANWDGRCDSLWCQAAGPIESPVEMNLGRVGLVRRIAGAPSLRAEVEATFGPLPDPSAWPEDAAPGAGPRGEAWATMSPADQDAATAVLVAVGKALAAFQRRLRTGEAPIDRYVEARLAGEAAASEAALSGPARRGLELFAGEGQCTLCHATALFTNREFHNIGLPPTGDLPMDEGRSAGIALLLADPLRADGPWSDAPDGAAAALLGGLRRTAEQVGQFKVPALRQVADTAPYFHDGSAETLEAAVMHYVDLPTYEGPGHREELMAPLPWGPGEVADVVAFLTEGLSHAGPPDPLLLEPPREAPR